MSKSKSKQKLGLFYRSHGKWTGPYMGMTFSEYSLNRQPMRGDVKWLKNRLLKSRIQIRPVKA